MKNIFYKISIILLILFAGCTDEVEFSSNTEALGGFRVISPASSTSNHILNSGTPNNAIQFSWTEATPGVSKTPTYMVSLFLVDAESAFTSFISDSEGTATTLSLSFSNIDQALADASFSAGAEATIQWQVTATNGDVEVETGKTNITFTRFSSDGIMAFNLLTPDNNPIITADVFGTPNAEVEFTWEEALTTSGAGIIEYTVLFDELDGDFSDPLFSFPIPSGLSFTMTHQEIGDNFASNPNVKWTVTAKITDSTPELKADAKYVNWDVFVINELYLVGDHNGWDNATATAFTNEGNGAFKLQVDLPAGAGFKFLPTLGSWNGDWGEDPANPGSIIQEEENNVSVTNAGTYVITVDFATLSFTVDEFTAPDNLYMVGDHNGWNNATANQFNNDGNGVFSLTLNFDAGNGFKFLPTLGSWDGDWGEDPANPGSIIQEEENNVSITNAGTYVVIVDFNTLTYNVSSIDNLYMVGDHNGWDNTTAPQLNSSGNGVFTIVQNFDAGNSFKFLPTLGSWDGDWGEDPDNAGKLVQNGENNLSIAIAGYYVVSVDFNTLTFKISELPDNLFLVGSPNGWDNTTAPAFTKLAEGVFEISQTLVSSDIFKFLPTLGSWDNDWGENPAYPGMLVRDGEDNVDSPGDGTFNITVDFTKGTITVL